MTLIIAIAFLHSSRTKRESQGPLNKNSRSPLSSSFTKNTPVANKVETISAYLRSKGSICII